MNHLLRSLLLTALLAAGAAGAHAALDQPLASSAQAATTSIGGGGVPGDFRCFLCDWAGCMTANVGGSGCDESSSGSCRVVDWGCVEWPVADPIAVRW